MKTLILDNYDSFTFNLFQFVGEIDERPEVHRNDAITLAEVEAIAPDRIILSPGPGHPANPQYFGVCRQVILAMGETTPILGVCLGHQGIFAAFGGSVVRAAEIMHGKTSEVFHDGRGIFNDLPQPFEAMRYHSLVGDPDTLPSCLEVTARTADRTIMGIRHREHPIFGVQFHPESIGTGVGRRLIENFIFLPERSWRQTDARA